jgi:hypothetical protein
VYEGGYHIVVAGEMAFVGVDLAQNCFADCWITCVNIENIPTTRILAFLFCIDLNRKGLNIYFKTYKIDIIVFIVLKHLLGFIEM